MKYSLLTALIAVLGLMIQSAHAELIQFSFSSNRYAAIQFTGGDTKEISFTNSSTDFDFTIQQISSNLKGLQGNIDGTFKVLPITFQETQIPAQPPYFPAMTSYTERAQIVSTGGKFTVRDGNGVLLTADLDWTDIYVNTLYVPGGSMNSGMMNATGVSNLKNFIYGGSDLELQQFAASGGNQRVNLTFQFPATKLLKDLMGGTSSEPAMNSTSYSGSGAATVPEPSTCVLLVTAGLGLAACVLRRRKLV